MDKVELDIQKRFVKTFQELEEQLAINNSKINALGWKKRNALISHVYSGYNKHEELIDKINEHEKYIQKGNVMQWIYDDLRKRRDLYGYFEDPEGLVAVLDTLIEQAVTRESYEIAEELNYWRKKLSA